MIYKTEQQLQSLSTRNLLAYYRAERKRYNCAISYYHFGFDAIDYMWDFSDKYEKEKLKFQLWEEYLFKIKQILSKREHIERN